MSINKELTREARSLLKKYFSMDLYKSPRPVDYMVDWFIVRIQNTYVPGGTLIDLGGGYSALNAVLSDLGMTVYCVDLLGDYVSLDGSKDPKLDENNRLRAELLSGRGVTLIHHDLLTYQFEDFSNDFADVICSYHCFEHLHHSPRHFAKHIKPTLKNNGIFFLELPNAVNLLKRLKVMTGRTNYPKYREYFDSEKWFGHIREYTTSDLKYLAEHIGFDKYEIFGRNHFGNLYGGFGYGVTPKLIDYCLRIRPGLCSSVYLKAIK